MQLRTHYLGLELKNPLVAGASPLGDSLDTARRLEDAGVAALVMHSLFEEQAELEQKALFQQTEGTTDTFAEAASYFPRYEEFALAPDQYAAHLQKLRSCLSIPVIASLNGYRLGGWVEQARALEQAGASALELNLYALSVDPALSAADVEEQSIQVVRAVRETVAIPVAVKLSPFYTSLAHFATAVDKVGADGLVLFNRFYQPDFDIEELEVSPTLQLSDRGELRLRLRWLSILSGTLECSLACSGGVHTADDLVKSVLAGADAVQAVSCLLRHGPAHAKVLLDGLRLWMEEHEYLALRDFKGAMDLRRCPDPAAHERANYIRILQSWKGAGS